MSATERHEKEQAPTSGKQPQDEQNVDETTIEAKEELAEKTFEELITELEETRRQAEEYLDQWQRAAAELANFRKRKERELADFERRANERLLLKLLPIYDDFERALESVPESLADEEWVDGIRLIERKFWSVLEQEQVSPIDSSPGTVFDPELHEALMTVETNDFDSDEIVDEFERGYMHNGRVLRPARVRVAK